jgi:hypothetical protein
VIALRHRFGEILRQRSISRDKSRMGWRVAPAYTRYHKLCRGIFNGDADKFVVEAERFKNFQFTWASTITSRKLLSALGKKVRAKYGPDFSFERAPFQGAAWQEYSELHELIKGDLGDLFRSIYRSEFKIAAGWLNYKKGDVIEDKFWHSDSGPGTRLNVFLYLESGELPNAPTTLLPWNESRDLFRYENEVIKARFDGINPNKKELRESLAEYYATQISINYPEKVCTPSGDAGLMVLFNNNTLHKADPPQPG